MNCRALEHVARVVDKDVDAAELLKEHNDETGCYGSSVPSDGE